AENDDAFDRGVRRAEGGRGELDRAGGGLRGAGAGGLSVGVERQRVVRAWRVAVDRHLRPKPRPVHQDLVCAVPAVECGDRPRARVPSAPTWLGSPRPPPWSVVTAPAPVA